MGDGLEREFCQLGGTVADDFAERAIDADEMPIERDQGHPDGCFIDREPKSLLRFVQRPFDALALADVARERLPATVRQDVGAHLDRHEGSVLPLLDPLGSVYLPRDEKFSPHRHQPRPLLDGNDLENGLAKQLIPFVAEQPACGLVDIGKAVSEIRLKECVRRKLDDIASLFHRSRDLFVRHAQ